MVAASRAQLGPGIRPDLGSAEAGGDCAVKIKKPGRLLAPRALR
jgi:hypothetical protein